MRQREKNEILCLFSSPSPSSSRKVLLYKTASSQNQQPPSIDSQQLVRGTVEVFISFFYYTPAAVCASVCVCVNASEIE